MSTAAQWLRLSQILDDAVADANRAGFLHSKADQQISLATYALYNLVDELSPVMRQPLGRVKASVHPLDAAVAARPGRGTARVAA